MANGITVTLSVFERGVLQQLMPRDGFDFATYGLIKAITEALDFTGDEREALGFQKRYVCPQCNAEKTGGGGVCERCSQPMREIGHTWTDGAVPAKGFEFTAEQVVFIKKLLSDLDAKKKLDVQTVGLFEKFVMNLTTPAKEPANVE